MAYRLGDDEDGPGGAPAISRDAHRFIQAYASPFTKPEQFDKPPRIPDLEFDGFTVAFALRASYDVQANQTTGGIAVISSPNPWGSLPVFDTEMMRGMNNGDSMPNRQARLLQAYGNRDLDHMLLRPMFDMARFIKQFRIVGHGLRLLPPNDLIPGNLFCCRVKQDDFLAQYGRLTNGINVSTPAAVNEFVWGYRDLYRLLDWNYVDAGTAGLFQTDTMKSCGLASTRDGAFNDSVPANKGAMVRVVQRNLNWPMWQFYDGTCMTTAVTTVNTQLQNTTSDNTLYQLGTKPYIFQGTPLAGTVVSDINAGFLASSTVSTSAGNYFDNEGYSIDGPNVSFGNPTYRNSVNMNHEMDYPMIIYTGGQALGQQSTYTAIWRVEVIWHIEAQVDAYCPMWATPSPVDPGWDEIKALIKDRVAFPDIASGHSFFGSIWNAMKSVGKTVGKVLRGGTKIVSGIPGAMSIPEVGAAVTAGKIIGGIL